MICVNFFEFFIARENVFILDADNKLSKLFDSVFEMLLFTVNIVLIPNNMLLKSME